MDLADFFAIDRLAEHDEETLVESAMQLQQVMMLYESGIREIKTKLDILADESRISGKASPINAIKSRIKTPRSIVGKLKRRGFPVTLQSMMDNLNDIGGIRVICPFIQDIYTVADMLMRQSDLTLIEKKDYISSPKPNGYRSQHLILEVPIFLAERTQPVRIELQIRTMAMNFWATIEHSLQYKYKENIPEYIQQKLLDASEAIIEVDHEMSDVRDEIMDAQNSHRKKETLVKDILNNIQNLYKVANQREVTKIQDEFYKVYVLDDMLQLKHFARQLDIISEGYRAQSL